MSRRRSVACRAPFRCLFLGFIFVAVLRWHIWFPPPPEFPESLASVSQLRSFLHDRLGLDAAPTGAKADYPCNLFLGRGPLERNRLMTLGRFPEHIGDWQGIVLVERINPVWEISPLLLDWEGCCLQLGPFLFFGDPALLAEIETALRSQQEKLQG
jgi:hypothetical protein